MEQIAFAVVVQTSNIRVSYTFTEQLSHDLTDIFTSKILLYQSLRQYHPLIHTADIDFFMPDIDHACRADCWSETGQNALEMNVHFFESDSVEDGVNHHFDMSPHEQIWQNENAVKTAEFFFWNFNPLLYQIQQDILKVRYPLLLLLLATHIQSTMNYHLHHFIGTFLKIKSGLNSTLKAY